MLVKARVDHNKFEDMAQSLSRKFIVEKLAVDSELLNSFRTIGTQLLTIAYVGHVELRVLDKEMENIKMKSRDQWKTVEIFYKMKYSLH